MGELGNNRSQQETKPSIFPKQQVRDWSAWRTIWHATDLLSASVVAMKPAVAKEAAEFLIANPAGVTVAALSLAHNIVNGKVRSEAKELEGDWQSVIRALRASTREDARSAMQWMDLALAHTVMGNRNNALRAAKIAITLAPNNRFVLRSASRCYLHWGDPDQGHSILKRSPATLSDPWLLSAEVAMSSARRRRSSLFTEARKMVKSGAFSPHETSELACGLGSLELEAGSRKHALPMLTRAMQQPTENAVAQVEWIFSKMKQPTPELGDVHIPRLYEATAVDHFGRGQWGAAVYNARQWLNDQPFSSRPPDLASYATALLGNYSEAVKLLEGARASNPDDYSILNNLAYFSVLDGDLSAAVRWMKLVNWNKLEDADMPALIATTGLLSFRTGDLEGGRASYNKAVSVGVQLRDARMEAIALINYSREELISGHPDRADDLLNRARGAAKRATGEDVKTLLMRLESRADVSAPSSTSHA